MRKRTIALIAVVAAVAAGLGLWSFQSLQGGRPNKTVSVAVGMDPTAVNSLISIAQDQGYFTANGLDVTIKQYDSGKAAVEGMLRGEVEIATAAEFVAVGQVLKKENIRVLASIDKFLHIYLVGRSDRGIRDVQNLKGKKIGVTLKTASEFYLGRLLDLHGIHMNEVTLVDVSPPRAVEVLVKGDVDAVIAWQPNVRAIEDRLGNAVIKWGAQKGQAAYCVVIGKGEWTAKHSEPIKQLLTSLVQAGGYAASHPAEANAIVQKALRYDDSYMTVIRPEHQLSVTLDQTLITAMEDEARWMIRNNLTTERQVPDFLSYTHEDALKAIKPAAVGIIR